MLHIYIYIYIYIYDISSLRVNICQELYFILLSPFFGVTFNRLPKFKFTFAGEVLGFSCLRDFNGVETEYGRFC